MITELTLENYRSIFSEKITFEPLTVVVGANGSGKSNLVKALELIADIPKSGLYLAASKQGGSDGISPKAYSQKDIVSHPTKIGYRVRLLPPNPNIAHPKELDVIHNFAIQFKLKGKLAILEEEVKFCNVLYVGRVLGHKDKKPTIEKSSRAHPTSTSFVEVIKNKGRYVTKENPVFSVDNLNDYINWFGLDGLESKFETPEELSNFLKIFGDGRRRRLGRSVNKTIDSEGLFTDPNVPTVLDFSPQAQVFLRTIQSIKRYDMLLHELRSEQSPSDSENISEAGANLPGALRKLHLKKENYKKVRSTFQIIAPHISDLKSSSLRTGKEFIEFVENRTGRGIESWQSSDGSLRALAILVALETADAGETVIIEEPEQNLHPWAVRTVIDHIRDVINRKQIQVILTTHSEHVLSRIEAHELRVAVRTLEFGTKFKTISQITTKPTIPMGEVGRLWVKGLLGGVPGEMD